MHCDIQERNANITRWYSDGECELRDGDAVSAVFLMRLITGYDAVYVAPMMRISNFGNRPENGHHLEGVKGVT